MADITTSLEAALRRATAAIMDDVATEGLVALRKILESAHFSRSEFLKGYQVYVHVTNTDLEYEIVISGESLEEPEKAQQESAEQEKKVSNKDALLEAYRTYGLTQDNKPIRYAQMRDVRRPARDARTPARDARKPARDARKGADDRLLEHEIALRAPRSMNLNQHGKLNLKFKRAVRETSQGMQYPQESYDGLIGQFVEELRKVILSSFAPALEAVIARYI